MRLVSLRAAEVPGVGAVELDHLPGGLVALVVPDGRLRRALHGVLADEGGAEERTTSPAGGDPALERIPDELATRLRTGRDLADLQSAADAGTRALAWVSGLDRVEAARARLGRLRGEAVPDGGPPESLLAHIRSLETAPLELQRLEEELRGLRGDDMEVAGDLEQATMTWLRERQDAETRLQAYRDRARELKATIQRMEESAAETPCPTCGRPLLDHYDQVRETLGDEWEGVVQDGGWWRRRREQLELKPEALQEMERNLLHLHAEARQVEEKVQVARARRDELEEATARLAAYLEAGSAPGAAAVSDGAARAVDDTLAELGRQVSEECRARLLDRAAAHLLHLTQGRLLGFRVTATGRVDLVGPEVDLPHPPDEDAAAAQVALRLAAVELLREEVGSTDASLVVGDPFDRLDDAVKVRAAGLFAERLGAGLVQVLLVTRGEVVDRVPELFDGVLELRVEGDGAVFRPLGAGSGRIRLATG